MVSILQRFLQQGFAFRTPRLLATDLYGQVQLVYAQDYVYVLTQTGLESNMGWQYVSTELERGWGELPMMAYTGGFRPKGVSFSGFRYMKGRAFHQMKYIKGRVRLLQPQQHLLVVLKEKRTKFKNLRIKQKDLFFQKLIYTGEISPP